MLKFKVLVNGKDVGLVVTSPDMVMVAHSVWALDATYEEDLPIVDWLQDARRFEQFYYCGKGKNIRVVNVQALLDTYIHETPKGWELKVSMGTVELSGADGIEYRNPRVIPQENKATKEVTFTYAHEDYILDTKVKGCRITLVKMRNQTKKDR